MTEQTERDPGPTGQTLPTHTQTLNELIATAASEWSKSDRIAIVAALHEQRERWNAEQSAGSRKRVPSTKVQVGKRKTTLSLDGLKL